MEKKQKILIVHNYYQIPGGEDTVVANEKKLLEDNGHDVVLYTRHNNELKSFSFWQKFSLPFTSIFNPRTYREIRQIIRKEQIDIVHVHNTLTLISPAVYYAALSCKIPVVQTIHNFRMLCPAATFYRDGHICEDCVEKGLWCAVKHKCYRDSKIQTLGCVINMMIHRMTGVFGRLNYICLTDFNRKKLLAIKQIKPDRVFKKPNFVDSPETIIPIEQRKNQFVFAGRIDKLKGVDILLEAWKLMGDEAPKLIICGTGPLDEWCRKYIIDNNLYQVEMTGFVSNTEVRKIISNSFALILPTQLFEGFPMTIVESYSVGTPVIGSNMGNVGSLVENFVTGNVFVSDSIFSLAETINQFESNPQLYFNVLFEFEQKYTNDKNYELLYSIYDMIR